MTFARMNNRQKDAFYGIKTFKDSTEITAQAVLNNVNAYIRVLEMKKRAGDDRAMLKMSAVYADLSIFDWWLDNLSLSNLKKMKGFLEEAIKLGFTGYVCFKVGATGCANGMWADTDLSVDGHSPNTGRTLYRSFTPDYTYWGFTDSEGKWLPEGKDYDSLKTVKQLEKAFYAQN